MSDRKNSYWIKLKDPRWQKKRLKILERSNFTCELCDDTETTLHVHHKAYRKGADPWDYEDYELQCLCENCHETITIENNVFDSVLFEYKTSLEPNISFLTGIIKVMISEQPPGFNSEIQIYDFEELNGIAHYKGYYLPDFVIEDIKKWGHISSFSEVMQGYGLLKETEEGFFVDIKDLDNFFINFKKFPVSEG
jgi:hypothetical protein